MIIFYCFAFILLGIILAKSADWVVKAISYFSHSLQVKSFLFGFVLLGFATTIPEMFVAYQAVRDNVPQLSVGNLLGGSIFLLSFVVGISALFLGRVALEHRMSVFDIAMSSFVVASPAFVFWDGTCSRTEGIILIALYIFHLVFLNREQHVVDVIERHAKHVKHAGHAILLGITGMAGMAVSSKYIVMIGEQTAHALGVPVFIIGLLLITFGTNLPELTLAIEAIMKKKRDIAFGDILGSAVVNTPILGIVGVVSPFALSLSGKTRATLVLLMMVSVFFFWAAATKKNISRKEGLALFVFYGAFVLFELFWV